MSLPNFIIVGETKCGTTSLFNDLIKHPDILEPYGNGNNFKIEYGQILGQKEIRFFDKYYWRGWDWYKQCFPICKDGQITGEATPMYLYRTQAIERILQYLPDCKLIILLRDPVDRLISHISHIQRIYPDWQDKYRDIQMFWESANENDYYLIDKGIYWRSLVPIYANKSTQVKIVKSEDFFTRPQTIYSNILEFLGVKDFKLSSSSKLRSTNSSKNNHIVKDLQKFYHPHNKKLKTLYNLDISWEYNL